MNTSRYLRIAILTAFLFASWSAAAFSTSGTMTLGPGDQLYLQMPGEPKLTGQINVAENGKVYLPLVDGMFLGSVDVNGKTVEQAKEALAKALSQYYNDTTMTLEVVSANVRSGPTVSVFGAVTLAGEQRHFDGMTLLDVLVHTNGVSVVADIKNGSLVRNGVTRKIDLTGLVTGSDMSQNTPVQPGDYLIIPTLQAPEKLRIHIFGKVASPGTFSVEAPVSIAAAIAASGGTVGRARTRKLVVIRMDREKNTPMAIPVNFGAIMNKGQLSENIAIKNDDIIFVPESSGVEITRIINEITNITFFKNSLVNAF